MRKQFLVVPVCAAVCRKRRWPASKKEGLEMTKESSRCQKAWELGERCRRERGTELWRKEGRKGKKGGGGSVKFPFCLLKDVSD